MELARELADRGVVRLPNFLTAEELEICQDSANERFGSILRAMLLKQVLRQTSGDAPLPTKFKEVVERDGGRLDVRHSILENPFSTIHAAIERSGLAETLSELLGEDAELVAAGNVVAMSMEGWAQHVDTGENEVLADNLGAQAWHADGPHLFTTLPDATLPAHAINIFVPLVDLTEENGPTEFAIGSHKLGHEYNEEEEEEVDGTSRVTSILAKAGDAILFDYRLWHRGLPNSSDTDRPMLYLVAARSFWRDDRNYSQGSSLFEQAASASSSTAAASSAQPPAGERVPLLKRRPEVQQPAAAEAAASGAESKRRGKRQRTAKT